MEGGGGNFWGGDYESYANTNTGGGGGATYGIFNVTGGTSFTLSVGAGGGNNDSYNGTASGGGSTTLNYGLGVQIGVFGGNGATFGLGGWGGNGYTANQVYGVYGYTNWAGQNGTIYNDAANNGFKNSSDNHDNLKDDYFIYGRGAYHTVASEGGYIRVYFCIS